MKYLGGGKTVLFKISMAVDPIKQGKGTDKQGPYNKFNLTFKIKLHQSDTSTTNKNYLNYAREKE